MTVSAIAGSNLERFLLTCLLRGMTKMPVYLYKDEKVSTHMPLARHDVPGESYYYMAQEVSTHMPLARHDFCPS